MKRHRIKKRFVLFILIVIILVIFACYILLTSYLDKGNEAVDPGNTAVITVTVPNGTSTEGIGSLLKSNGLITDSRLFKIKSKWMGYEDKYKAGEYDLSPGMTMDQIMQIIIAGNDRTTRFTIPEGYDINKTSQALLSAGLINKDKFEQEIESGDFDYWFLQDAPSGKNRLEGYLFPETYEIFTDADEHDIIDKMLSQFEKVFTEEHKQRAEELNMNINEVLTLASIIEREAVVPADRPVISGVFHNRLKKGMKLQSCATVQYILGEQKAVLSTADTQIESPYNTYIITGLPPAPICSPGLESIDAALWPEDTNYLYFLAKGDGSHVFAITYEEHLRNKAKYID